MRAGTREGMISITSLVLVISIGFLVPKAAAQSNKYSTIRIGAWVADPTCRKTKHTPITDGSLPLTAIPRAARRTGRSLSRGARAAMPPSVPPPSAAA
jgi:hypothetical protein